MTSSGGSQSTTVQNGYFLWINDVSNLQLDIVGFLAILGEGSVLANSQVATLSKIVFLPRLVPAPQALLRPSRPSKLSPHDGYATSVWSGNLRDYINHVGGVIVGSESFPEYSVRCVQIVRKNNKGTVKAKVFGPLWAVAALGCILALILFALAVWKRDGMGLLATILLSLLSTLIGWGNKWTLNLPKRGIHTGESGEKPATIFTPPGDVVIRYPKGNFLIVQCVEDVARELYFAPENIDYLIKPPWQYRMVSLVGTLMLMFGVIFLGNSGTPLQIAYAVAYMLLNVAYWVVAALPSRLHWDMSCFEVHEQCFATPDGKCPEPTGKIYVDHNKSFTQGLWKAIIATKDIDWVERSSAAPKTTAWNEWLHEAKTKAKEAKSWTEMVDGKEVKVYDVPDWNPQKALADCLNRSKDPDEV